MNRWGGSEGPLRVKDLKAKAELASKRLAVELDRNLNPAESKGKSIAKSFWGFGWCQYLEKYMDYESRLPRGRSYLKNGCVIDLQVSEGMIEAYVSGNELYHVQLAVDEIDAEIWANIKNQCRGCIDSTIALLSGDLSDEVMSVISDPESGMFPKSNEIRLICNCPDWADMCKHVSAVLYGFGARLDEEPEMIFRLRGVSPDELVDDAVNSISDETSGADDWEGDDLGDLFGIELDESEND